MDAFKEQGYTACNKLKINKQNKNTKWTVLEVQDLATKTRALKYGIKFGDPPDQVDLKVKEYKPKTAKNRSAKPNTKDSKKQGNASKGKGKGKGKGRGKGLGKELNQNKSNMKRSKTPDPPSTTPYKGKGKDKRRRHGKGKYANDTNYHKYNKNKKNHNKFIGFYMTAIIDMSGSMAGSRIKAATQGVHALMSNLNDNDFVSIIGFNSAMIKILEPSRYGTVKEQIPKKLAQCIDNVSGGTAMWDALNEAIQRQKEFMKKWQKKNKTKRKQRIIVVTDGEDNSSEISSEDVCREAAFFNLHGAKDFEFVLTVIAVGEAKKSKSLQKLCKPKHCHLVEVDDYNGIAKAIQNEWKRK
eukprot:489870_1